MARTGRQARLVRKVPSERWVRLEQWWLALLEHKALRVRPVSRKTPEQEARPAPWWRGRWELRALPGQPALAALRGTPARKATAKAVSKVLSALLARRVRREHEAKLARAVRP